MVTGLIGKKLGMTQLFQPDGSVQPATVLKAGPCVVAQVKTVETDGYAAAQLGLVEAKPTRENKPSQGHFKKAGVPATRVRREVKLAPGADPVKPGDQVSDRDVGGGRRRGCPTSPRPPATPTPRRAGAVAAGRGHCPVAFRHFDEQENGDTAK